MTPSEKNQLQQVMNALDRERKTTATLQSEIKSLRASMVSAPAQAQSVGDENWSALTLLEVGNILGNTGKLETLPALARGIMAELKQSRQ